MTPTFSIVIPNYNSGPVLERCIQSLLGQNYPKLQLILADSCSTDESKAIIEKYREHFDVLIIEKDKGQADGLNKGFARATGEIFGWLCADDELLPGALHHAAEIFMAHPEIDMVTGKCERVMPDGETRFVTGGDPETWDKIGIQNIIEQPSTFWKSAFHRKVGQLDTSYYLGFDWDMWARLRNAGARLHVTDRVMSRYYFSDTNKTGSAGPLFVKEAFRLVKNYGPLRGGLAHIYRFLYRHFDLKGCYDKPPRCSKYRFMAFMWTMATLRVLIGKRLLLMYNWHFAACQERNIKWY